VEEAITKKVHKIEYDA
jgi:tubulin-specific chaperone E